QDRGRRRPRQGARARPADAARRHRRRRARPRARGLPSCARRPEPNTRPQRVDVGGLVRTAHPYMANSVPEIKEEMLDAIGVSEIEELFAQIPERHRLRGRLPLPAALASEVELSRHLRQTLARNATCEENL